ncbi:hypothetical protein AVEN_217108-1 [Araneus ventricosus]|uniref:Uncharacterized protein n=1 Tax=Araneus ventricosus TaxID=182803 RepID=A0A4Y2WNC5_ARAVE|nr:hypothetical protein AVEN_100525-1 [Araneus ventricosus]GBO39021.1 hypothetical protein AVEN_217108-1 [Araneus ventricosus]
MEFRFPAMLVLWLGSEFYRGIFENTASFLRYLVCWTVLTVVRSSLALKFPQEKTPHKPFLGPEEKEPRCLSRAIKLQTTLLNRRAEKTPRKVGHLRDRQKDS